MQEKFILPTFDYYGNRVEIKGPTRMFFFMTGTCTDKDFHPHRAWTFDEFEKRAEDIASKEQLQEYIVGWANDVFHAHERTGCTSRPLISVMAQDYTFRV